jgi:hypothetical protein
MKTSVFSHLLSMCFKANVEADVILPYFSFILLCVSFSKHFLAVRHTALPFCTLQDTTAFKPLNWFQQQHHSHIDNNYRVYPPN